MFIRGRTKATPNSRFSTALHALLYSGLVPLSILYPTLLARVVTGFYPVLGQRAWRVGDVISRMWYVSTTGVEQSYTATGTRSTISTVLPLSTGCRSSVKGRWQRLVRRPVVRPRHYKEIRQTWSTAIRKEELRRPLCAGVSHSAHREW